MLHLLGLLKIILWKRKLLAELEALDTNSLGDHLPQNSSHLLVDSESCLKSGFLLGKKLDSEPRASIGDVIWEVNLQELDFEADFKEELFMLQDLSPNFFVQF